MFGSAKKTNAAPQAVTSGRFELEEDGKIAYLNYSLGGGILELVHTEVPPELRHKGLAAELAKSALDYAREHKLKVDIVCASVADYVAQHPEYEDLVLK